MGDLLHAEYPHAEYPDRADHADYGCGFNVGSILRQVREEHGLSLDDVAAALKIRRVYLQAIEDGRFSALPGRAYAFGFIRSYAHVVGLDAEAMVRQFKDEIDGRTAQQALYVPTPAPETRIPGGTILLMSVLLAVTAFGAWYYLSATRFQTEAVGPPLPQQLVALLEPRPAERTTAHLPEPPPAAAAGVSTAVAPAAAGSSGGPAASGAASGSTSASAAGGSRIDPRITMADILGADALRAAVAPKTARAPVEVAGSDEDDDASADTVGPAASGSAQAGRAAAGAAGATASAAGQDVASRYNLSNVFGKEHEQSRILIRATAETWVQVRGEGGDPLFSRILRVGEGYRVPDRPGVSLRLGNAAGVVVAVDGVDLPPLGRAGQVVRGLALDPARLRQQVSSTARE